MEVGRGQIAGRGRRVERAALAHSKTWAVDTNQPACSRNPTLNLNLSNRCKFQILDTFILDVAADHQLVKKQIAAAGSGGGIGQVPQPTCYSSWQLGNLTVVVWHTTVVDHPTQLICISDIYLLMSTDKYKRHSRAIC